MCIQENCHAHTKVSGHFRDSITKLVDNPNPSYFRLLKLSNTSTSQSNQQITLSILFSNDNHAFDEDRTKFICTRSRQG